MTNQLTFNSTALVPVTHNNQTWLTSADLANALGYARADSVSRIFDRNKDEFSECMAQTVNLTGSGKKPDPKFDTRIFSLRGCHLIAMFSRTKVAKQFRKWVLDILDLETAELTSSPDSLLNSFIKTQKEGKYILCVNESGVHIEPFTEQPKTQVDVRAVMGVRKEIGMMINRLGELSQRVAVLSGDEDIAIFNKAIK